MKNRRILCNDDGEIGGSTKPPMSIDDIQKMLATYEGSPVDALLWCIGDHEVYEYETEVGERFGTGLTQFKDERTRWRSENLDHMIKTTGGPLTSMIQACREASMDIFASVRMNSHYAYDEDDPNYGRYRKDHADLLIGSPGEPIPHPTVENAIRSGLDYKLHQNRSYITNVICELFERFDVDGIELDFMRHPGFFRPLEAYGNRYLITDLIRVVRSRMDAIGQQRNKHLDLAVRVAPTLADSARIGLDAELWIKENLVDIVIVGVGFIPFEMPIREFVDLAEDKPCQIYGAVEALRWATDEAILNALAQRFFHSGADGMYLFNFFGLPNEWKRRVLGGIADPIRVKGLDKQYELDHSDRIESTEGHLAAFRYAIPAVQLPVLLVETLSDRGVILQLEIADDVQQAVGNGNLLSCRLGLGFDELSERDQLTIRLNERSIDWDSGKISTEGWHHSQYTQGSERYSAGLEQATVEGTWVEFELNGTDLRQDTNALELRLVSPDPERDKPLMLREVRINIKYR